MEIAQNKIEEFNIIKNNNRYSLLDHRVRRKFTTLTKHEWWYLLFKR